MKTFFLALTVLSTFTASRAHAAWDCNSQEIVCPADTGDTDKYTTAVANLIAQQGCCWGAKNVYDDCAQGNTYDLGDQASPLITVCEKAIVKDKGVLATYKSTLKSCERDGQSRQDYSIQTQCYREAAELFGFIVETVKQK
jgi:hypothetical protein